MGVDAPGRSPLPGDSARSALASFISQRTMERVFDPIVADLHAEWQAADGRLAALGARTRAYVALLRATATLLALRASHAVGRSTLRFGLHLALAAALVFTLFFVLAHITGPDANPPRPPRSRPDTELSDAGRADPRPGPIGGPRPGRAP